MYKRQRVYRSGVPLLATPGLILQLGDRLTVVGEKAAIQNVEKVLGNAVKSLKEPNLVVDVYKRQVREYALRDDIVGKRN